MKRLILFLGVIVVLSVFVFASTAILDGTIKLEARSSNSSLTHASNLTVKMKNNGTGNITTYYPTSNSIGGFMINDVEKGNYTIWIKPEHWLAVSEDKEINYSYYNIDFGTAEYGDFADTGASYNKVDYLDLSIFSGAYGSDCNVSSPSCDLCNTEYKEYIDADGDCKINYVDLAVFSGNYGKSGAPEP